MKLVCRLVTDHQCLAGSLSTILNFNMATIHILFLGDIVGEPGRKAVIEQLPILKETESLDFIIVNGENAAGGKGITPKIAIDLLRAGAAVITTGDLVVNLDTKTVEVAGQRVHLTGKEYQMLELLSLRKGTTLTKEMFLNHLYGGMDEPELKIIDVFICKLRKKLSEATGGENHIETVWGRGYVLRDPEKGRQAERLAVGA